jgi:hypothetical protein
MPACPIPATFRISLTPNSTPNKVGRDRGSGKRAQQLASFPAQPLEPAFFRHERLNLSVAPGKASLQFVDDLDQIHLLGLLLQVSWLRARQHRRCAGNRCSGTGCRRSLPLPVPRSGVGFCSRNGTRVIRMPGVQKPHCNPCASQKPRWMGCSSSGPFARPSTVVRL